MAEKNKSYAVKLEVDGVLIGTHVHPRGGVVTLPERFARQMVRDGTATPSGVVANLALADAIPLPPPAPEPKPVEYGGTWIRVLKGQLFDRTHTYTPDDGVVLVHSAIPYECLLETQPAPPARQSRTIIELIGLTPERRAELVEALRAKTAPRAGPAKLYGPTVNGAFSRP